MATIKDVAALAGVSFTTVSHVLNNTRPVSDKARARVLAAVEQMGYLPSAVARSLRRSETKIIAVLVPNVNNPFFAELVGGVEEVCREAGYSVFLCNSANDPARQQEYMRTLLEKRVDGLLLSSAGDGAALAKLMNQATVPAVSVDRLVSDIRADRVALDNHQAARLAVEHLLSLGHRRIACISGPVEFDVACDRVAGWREALLAAGVAPEADWLVESDFSSAGGHAAAHALLSGAARPSALFACNDLMAIGALRAAAELKRPVPEQLSVLGFDDIEQAEFTTPPLSTVGCGIKELGRAAGRALLDRIDNPGAPLKDLLLKPRLVRRESCAVLSTQTEGSLA